MSSSMCMNECITNTFYSCAQVDGGKTLTYDTEKGTLRLTDQTVL